MMALYARPTRLEYEINFKVKELIKYYQRHQGLTGEGAGQCITKNSLLYMFLLGAQAALNNLAPTHTLEDKARTVEELDKILGMVIDNHQVILEDK